ncbi:hypothetical protein [Phenylobacterium soli]|uniref:hypothetical protein n=1 Tax=Phenylobacterium soli TaxID=2170551 RepID=UPI001057E2E6|nr:hypothetical protein [Phenylobacterium soli]
MTQEEAKTKWCPHARPAGWEDPGGFNRDRDGGACITSKCIASACMAWRWSEAKRTAAFLDAVQAHMKASGKPNFATATQAVYAERGREFERTEGYCGLAGAPQ